jgi:hypothetical protein
MPSFLDQAHGGVNRRKVKVENPAIPDGFVIGGLLLDVVVTDGNVVGDAE